ncbi:MAG: glycosyltransferase family 2 protein [Planctomycetes bacterium]|nr:glycosyltransferase family 2 protein [Planctomycetota bacterium]
MTNQPHQDAPAPRNPPGSRYCIVIPCRDEEDTLERTVRSLAAQTTAPDLVVIVDDGSTDRTPEICARLAGEFAFVRVLRRQDRGRRSVGPGVIDAFYDGLATFDVGRYDFVCKLDADLEMPPRYFARILERMAADPRIGAMSGRPYYQRPGPNGLEMVPEPCGIDVCVGATKFYRRACFEAIGGFVRAVMWDGIDAHTCRMLGWRNFADEDPELRYLHLRPMGSSDHNVYRGRVRWGRGQWFMGTGALFILASATNRILTPPILVGSVLMLFGYVSAWWRGEPRYDRPGFRTFLRRYQRLALLKGKRRAMEMVLDAGPRADPGPAAQGLR